ncbi:MAG: metallophosphoesterase [Gemmatimonadetes bacterium]|nr:metallophosphoesterase [Gemmatimonadota bacterium]
MATPPISEAEAREALAAVEKYGSVAAASVAMGMPRTTLQSRVRSAKAREMAFSAKPTFTAPILPDGEVPIEEIIDRLCRGYGKRAEAEDARRLIPVTINREGPIGIVHIGDPHVDDDGCNWPLLRKHLDVIRKTDCLLGATVGDLQNSWIGRLARLYGNQETSARTAWRLVEWFVRSIPWLYIVKGNHDMWAGNGDPLDWMARSVPGPVEPWGCRIDLRFPNGRGVRVNARHDFSGHSMWSTVHGPVKAATMGWRDHILTCGHKHTSGYAVLKDPSTGLVSHAIRVGGYKQIDDYGKELGLPNQNIFPSAVTVIDPRFEDDDPRLVTTLFDVEEGAEYLTWRRRKAEKGSRAA